MDEHKDIAAFDEFAQRIERAAGIVRKLCSDRNVAADELLSNDFRLVAKRDGLSGVRTIEVNQAIRKAIAAMVRSEIRANDVVIDDVSRLFFEMEPILTRIEAVLDTVDVKSNAG